MFFPESLIAIVLAAILVLFFGLLSDESTAFEGRGAMSLHSLDEYRSKRDFSSTPEPRARKRKGKKNTGNLFVIQEHAASSHHFDFRLQVGDVLRSWAVPKGPSTDPSEKRLALPTEDHPLEYAEFEGVIPEGEYGGGTVSVCDTGEYELIEKGEARSTTPMDEQLQDGHATFRLKGSKIRGGYALTRIGSDRWLLVKMADDEADARRNPVSTEPESVLSGRTLSQIAKEEGQTSQDGRSRPRRRS